jgi:hypothetical protein
MSLKYRTSAGTSESNFTDLVVKVGDTLPIGTEVDYDGQTAPAGWQEVDDPSVYSTTETRIGTWIDGKPLYRKVFTISATVPSNSSSSGGSVGIFNKATYNADEIFIKDCRIDNSDKSVALYVPYAGGQPRYIGISRINNDISVVFYNAFSNEQVTITTIIEYTKTTD